MVIKDQGKKFQKEQPTIKSEKLRALRMVRLTKRSMTLGTYVITAGMNRTTIN